VTFLDKCLLPGRVEHSRGFVQNKDGGDLSAACAPGIDAGAGRPELGLGMSGKHIDQILVECDASGMISIVILSGGDRH
jgi:hypothetical protein